MNNEYNEFEYVDDEQSLQKVPTTELTENELINKGIDAVNNIANIYNASLQVERDIAAVKAWSNVKLAEVAEKYKQCENILNKTFSERDKALSKHYALLDKGIETNNKEYIVMAMQGISGIVTSSPLADLEKIEQAFNNPSVPLLDF